MPLTPSSLFTVPRKIFYQCQYMICTFWLKPITAPHGTQDKIQTL